MSETTTERKEWYEVVDRHGVACCRRHRRHSHAADARDTAVEHAQDFPHFAPFRVIRVTETREEVT